MKNKRYIISVIAAAVIILMASIASAVPSAIVEYHETDLGGSWQYNYVIKNTSTEGEALHEVFFYFTGDVTATGSSLPSGWHGLPWTGTYLVSYLNAYSTDFTYDILAGGALGGFSFTVDYRAGGISYVAYFSGDKQFSGTTAVCQPLSLNRDMDGDGYGNPSDPVQACIESAGYVADNTDCDDTSSAIHPDTLWYADSDGDGYGDPAVYLQQCTAPEGYVLDNTDCDDNSSAINPERYWYQDNDGDGFGTYSLSIQQCLQPTGPPDYVLNDMDYDDYDPGIGAPVRIAGITPIYYGNIYDAYIAASEGDTIQVLAVLFSGTLDLDRTKSVILAGGYFDDFTYVSSNTAIMGDMIISNGTLKIENFLLQ